MLAAKQAAGADLAITQVFYDPADYVALTNAASYAGVSIPILPGVIPLTDLRRLTRLEALTGVKVPDALRSSLGSASGATLVERGIGATLDLATALLRAGARTTPVHLQSDPARPRRHQSSASGRHPRWGRP